jgi:hypothetical protein
VKIADTQPVVDALEIEKPSFDEDWLDG